MSIVTADSAHAIVSMEDQDILSRIEYPAFTTME